MKRLLPFLLIFISVQIHAQSIKILFDATKAEMAGNADWVIDADQYNLGTNSSGAMVTGAGNEANPQRIPTSAQSGITSTTSETYWKGALSSWAIDLVRKGYTVETLPYNGQITYGSTTNTQDLSNYKVFIVDEPNIRFTSAEKTAILNWVAAGGGLFMISDHDVSDRNNDGWDSPHIWNDLMSSNSVKTNPFGITFDYQNFSQTTSTILNSSTDPILHGSMGNVTALQFSNGTSMTLSKTANSTVKGLIFKTGSSTTGTTAVMFAGANYGSGKVCAIGDSSPCDDGTGDPNDALYSSYKTAVSGSHQKLFVNAVIWLTTAGTAASPVAPTNTTAVNARLAVNQPSNIFSVYPNPASEEITVSFLPVAGGKAVVSVMDLTGKIIFSESVETGSELVEQHIDLGSFSPGMYFVRLDEAGSTRMQRFIRR